MTIFTGKNIAKKVFEFPAGCEDQKIRFLATFNLDKDGKDIPAKTVRMYGMWTTETTSEVYQESLLGGSGDIARLYSDIKLTRILPSTDSLPDKYTEWDVEIPADGAHVKVELINGIPSIRGGRAVLHFVKPE